jgi:hypothetical protein
LSRHASTKDKELVSVVSEEVKLGKSEVMEITLDKGANVAMLALDNIGSILTKTAYFAS